MTGARARDEGFSLIELMTILAIMGVLVAVAIASFAVSVDRSRRIACIHNQRLMDTGLMQYQIMNQGNWPDRLDDVKPYVKWSGDDFATCTSDTSADFDYAKATGEISCPNPDHAR